MRIYIFICLLLCGILHASENLLDFPYQLPSEEIVELFDRPYHPSLSVLGKKDKILYRENYPYVPLEWLSEDIAQYGEINIYKNSRARRRGSFNSSFYVTDLTSLENDIYSNRINLPENRFWGGELVSPSQNNFLFI